MSAVEWYRNAVVWGVQHAWGYNPFVWDVPALIFCWFLAGLIVGVLTGAITESTSWYKKHPTIDHRGLTVLALSAGLLWPLTVVGSTLIVLRWGLRFMFGGWTTIADGALQWWRVLRPVKPRVPKMRVVK